MLDVIDMYCKGVIKPVEDYTNELRMNVENKGIIEKLFHIDYKDKVLEEMEQLLYKCYTRLSTIIDEEIAFDKHIQEELKRMEEKNERI